jgi:hypothetical protein
MNRTETPDLAAWVEQADDAAQRELREAVHTILTAIANDPTLRTCMIIKGGILLATRYHSPRFTKDIDFSTAENLQLIPLEEIQHRLNSALPLAVELLDYGMDCRLQSSRINPPNRPNATFPSMGFKIGYALKSTPKHARLLKLQSPSVISIDFSLNEVITGTEKLAIGGQSFITAYTFADHVAEKFRSRRQVRGHRRLLPTRPNQSQRCPPPQRDAECGAGGDLRQVVRTVLCAVHHEGSSIGPHRGLCGPPSVDHLTFYQHRIQQRILSPIPPIRAGSFKCCAPLISITNFNSEHIRSASIWPRSSNGISSLAFNRNLPANSWVDLAGHTLPKRRSR